MSFQRNVLANYASQIYVAGAGILVLPLYVKYMGAEAYGLVGFYTMLQAWFQLLDAGLSTTLSRESAKFNGGGTEARTLVHLTQILELVFIAFALTAVALSFSSADMLTASWLRIEQLSQDAVRSSIQLMGIIIAFRWQSCLYRSIVTGFEKQVWLGGFNTVIATLRFMLCIPVLALDASPFTFFSYQAAVAAFETAVLWKKSRQLLPSSESWNPMHWRWASLKPSLVFASGAGFTSVIWVVVTQVDKLALSKILPLSDYGQFTLGVALASGITLLSAPVGAALVPRLTRMAASGQHKQMEEMYRKYTRVVCMTTIPPALTLFFFSKEILFAWTGNSTLAEAAAPVLGLYSLGNAVLGITSFSYYIQYAKGDIHLHIRGNTAYAAFYIPTAIAGAYFMGGWGAGLAWLTANLLYLSLWVPVVHAHMLPGLHGRWLRSDICKPLAMASVPVLFLYWNKPSWGRVEGAFAAAAFGFSSLMLVLLSTGILRQWLSQQRSRLSRKPSDRK